MIKFLIPGPSGPISFEPSFVFVCDSKTGWESDNSLGLNKTIHKRGIGCLQSNGSSADEFRRIFLTPFSAGSSTAFGFWYYVEDVSKLDDDNQVELGSGPADHPDTEWG